MRLPDQKTYEDYGLPSVKNLPKSLFADTPRLLPKVKSTGLAETQVVEIILGKKNIYRRVRTPLEPVIIQKDFLIHVIKKRAAARERYANFIVPTLTDPNEVWLASYNDGFRRRFIKFFQGKKNMLVVARENMDGSLFWNAIPADSRYIDNQRTGVLLYKNKVW